MELERPASDRPQSLATLTDLMSELGSVSDIAEEVHAWSLAPETPDMSDSSTTGTELGLPEPPPPPPRERSRERAPQLDVLSTQSRTDSVDGLSTRASAAALVQEEMSETGSIGCGASSVDWIGERVTGALSLSNREPVVQANSAQPLKITCDDTVLEFGMDTNMHEEMAQDNMDEDLETWWPTEHHAFDSVAVFSWTLVSLASVARRHPAGRYVDSPALQAPDQPATRWLVRLFPSGKPDNERAFMVTSFGCLSLDKSLGGAAIVRVTLEAETDNGPVGCEYFSLLREGFFHCEDFLLPRHGAPRDLHLTVRVAWSEFQVPPQLAAPPPVHGLVTRFDTGRRKMTRKRHDNYQVRVRAVWRIERFSEWRPPRGTQLVSPLFGCDAVLWTIQLWPNGGRGGDPAGFLRASVHLIHLPAAMRSDGIRVSLRVDDGNFRNTSTALHEDGVWGCLASPRRLCQVDRQGHLVLRVELWYDSPTAD